LNWKSILVNEKVYPWHKESPKQPKDKELINGPRVYRWVFKNQAGEVESIYIGQSEKFQNRLSGYRTPTKINQKDTDVIVHRAFSECERHGGTIELQFLEVEKLEINGQLIDTTIQSLGNQEIRLLLELIAVLTAKLEKAKLHNRFSKNVHEKDLEKLIRIVPMNVMPDFSEHFQTNNQTREVYATQK